MPDHYVTIWRMWPEEAGNSSESRSIKARSTGEGSLDHGEAVVDDIECGSRLCSTAI